MHIVAAAVKQVPNQQDSPAASPAAARPCLLCGAALAAPGCPETPTSPRLRRYRAVQMAQPLGPYLTLRCVHDWAAKAVYFEQHNATPCPTGRSPSAQASDVGGKRYDMSTGPISRAAKALPGELLVQQMRRQSSNHRLDGSCEAALALVQTLSHTMNWLMWFMCPAHSAGAAVGEAESDRGRPLSRRGRSGARQVNDRI